MSLSAQSYGHAYLSSYGWQGTGTALRNGAIDKPLAIPPKKNLSGLGKDRDEAFPFWDHLFAAASKAITIKVSNVDEDTSDAEDVSKPTDTHAGSLPLKRTATGIISNRRPITGTPASASASASGTTTPNPNANGPGVDSGGRLSLVAAAKREAAKQGLYSRFFRGPTLGPDEGPHVGNAIGTPSTSTPVPSTDSDSSSISTPAPEQTDLNPTETAKKTKKRKSGDREKTKEEERERKRLKKERRAAKAAKKTRKAKKALEKERAKEKDGLEDSDQRVRKPRGKEASGDDEKRGTSPSSKKSRKQDRESADGAGDPVIAKSTRKKSKKESSTSDENENETSRIPTEGISVVLTTKKKKGKRKDTTS